MCGAGPRICCDGSRKDRSTPPLSSPTRHAWMTAPTWTRPSRTRRTAASRWCSSPAEENMGYRTDSNHRGHPVSRAWGMAQGLGWFSIALGLMEVMAPRKLAHTLGMDEHEKTIFGYGVREIATGIAILTAKDPTPWIWGRVGGDAL